MGGWESSGASPWPRCLVFGMMRGPQDDCACAWVPAGVGAAALGISSLPVQVDLPHSSCRVGNTASIGKLSSGWSLKSDHSWKQLTTAELF